MIYGWEEFGKWATTKGLDLDEDVVMLVKRNKTIKQRFSFWNDGAVNVTSDIAGMQTRICLAENRNIEDMKKMIEALM